jgi:preprotein translocase subunit YajC
MFGFFQLVDCNCEVMFLPCVLILVLFFFFVINCEGHLL